jgi:hypothetical protein
MRMLVGAARRPRLGSMHLVQILLPLTDNDGVAFTREDFAQVRSELSEHFGGITAFTRSPAEGVWTDFGKAHRDDLFVLEVMARDIDHAWWEAYRAELERRFRQETLAVRAIKVDML